MSSNQRPDTLMQDRSPPARRIFLLRTAGPYIGSDSALGRSPPHDRFGADELLVQRAHELCGSM